MNYGLLRIDLARLVIPILGSLTNVTTLLLATHCQPAPPAGTLYR
jgi:hypothetical protein